MRDSFVFYREWRDAMVGLPDGIRMEVYEAVIEYGVTGKVPELKPMAELAFRFVKARMDKDTERYDETCRKRSEAGTKGMAKRWHGNDNADNKNNKCNTDNTDNTDNKSNEDNNDNTTIDDNKHNLYDMICNDMICSDNDNIKKQKEKEKKDAQDEERVFLSFLKYFNDAIAASGSSIKPCKELDDERREALRKILAKYKVEDIKVAIRNIVYSNYANGRSGSRKKAADIDWLLKMSNFKHAFEGSL